MSTKLVKFILGLIFLLFSLRTCQITRSFYDLINPFTTISFSLILLEDVLFLVLSLLVVLWFVRNRKLTIEKGIMSELILFFCAGLLLLFYAFMLGNADLFANFRLFALTFLGLAFWWSFKTRRHLFIWTKLILCIFIIDTIITLINFQCNPHVPSKHLYYNELLAPLGLVMSCFVIRYKRLFPRLYYIILPIIGIAIFNMLLYGSRSTYAYCLVFLSFMSCFYIRHFNFKLIQKSNIMRMGIVFVTVTIVIAIFTGIQDVQLINNVEKQVSRAYKLEGTARVRLVAWDILIKRIAEKPIMGRGLGGKGDGIDIRFYKESGRKGLYIGSAHNAWLILMYQIGAVGMIIIGLFIFRLFRIILKEKSKMTNIHNFYLSLILSGFGAFLIEVSFHPLGPNTFYYFWFYLGTAIAAVKINIVQNNTDQLAYGKS